MLLAYADSIAIDMVPDGCRYVGRNGVPLLGLGPLELFEQEESKQLLTRCAVWYGEDALVLSGARREESERFSAEIDIYMCRGRKGYIDRSGHASPREIKKPSPIISAGF